MFISAPSCEDVPLKSCPVLLPTGSSDIPHHSTWSLLVGAVVPIPTLLSVPSITKVFESKLRVSVIATALFEPVVPSAV